MCTPSGSSKVEMMSVRGRMTKKVWRPVPAQNGSAKVTVWP